VVLARAIGEFNVSSNLPILLTRNGKKQVQQTEIGAVYRKDGFDGQPFHLNEHFIPNYPSLFFNNPKK
jgi:hypothetical protein